MVTNGDSMIDLIYQIIDLEFDYELKPKDLFHQLILKKIDSIENEGDELIINNFVIQITKNDIWSINYDPMKREVEMLLYFTQK